MGSVVKYCNQNELIYHLDHNYFCLGTMESVEVNMLTCTLIFLIKVVCKFASSTICGKLKFVVMKVTVFNTKMFVFQTRLKVEHVNDTNYFVMHCNLIMTVQ